MDNVLPTMRPALALSFSVKGLARALRLASIIACVILACMILAGAVYTLAQVTGGSLLAYVASAITVLLIMLAIAGNFTKGA